MCQLHNPLNQEICWDVRQCLTLYKYYFRDVRYTFLVCVFQAVKHLHDNNLVHMDIKPDNIFVSQEGIYKLGDFGLVIDLSKVIVVRLLFFISLKGI